MDYQLYHIADLPAADPSMADAAELARHTQQGGDFLRIRCALKRELARRCRSAPADIHLNSGGHGKPEFAPQPFNISHSGGLLCMAFHHGAVGVDIERHRPRRFERLAAHFMADEQLSAFLERGCPPQEFFDCWCAAEALVKQAGDSIWNAKSYPFRYAAGRIIPLFENAPTVLLFCPAAGFSGAVAYHEGNGEGGL